MITHKDEELQKYHPFLTRGKDDFGALREGLRMGIWGGGACLSHFDTNNANWWAYLLKYE